MPYRLRSSAPTSFRPASSRAASAPRPRGGSSGHSARARSSKASAAARLSLPAHACCSARMAALRPGTDAAGAATGADFDPGRRQRWMARSDSIASASNDPCLQMLAQVPECQVVCACRQVFRCDCCSHVHNVDSVAVYVSSLRIGVIPQVGAGSGCKSSVCRIRCRCSPGHRKMTAPRRLGLPRLKRGLRVCNKTRGYHPRGLPSGRFPSCPPKSAVTK